MVRQPGFRVEGIGEILEQRRALDTSQRRYLQSIRIYGIWRQTEVLFGAVNVRR